MKIYLVNSNSWTTQRVVTGFWKPAECWFRNTSRSYGVDVKQEAWEVQDFLKSLNILTAFYFRDILAPETKYSVVLNSSS